MAEPEKVDLDVVGWPEAVLLRLASLESRVPSLEARFASLEGHLAALDGRLRSLEQRYGGQPPSLPPKGGAS